MVNRHELATKRVRMLVRLGWARGLRNTMIADEAGVNVGTISKMMNEDGRKPDVDTLDHLASAIGRQMGVDLDISVVMNDQAWNEVYTELVRSEFEIGAAIEAGFSFARIEAIPQVG